MAAECELRREWTAAFLSDLVDQLALLGIYKKIEIECISPPGERTGYCVRVLSTDNREISALCL